jgi:poly(A) polymerase
VNLHTRILSTLTGAGHSAYQVGGSVRDLLLNRPSKDIDIATSAKPEEVLALFPRSDFVGAHFGVVLVKDESTQIEVATYRIDGEYTDSRHPESVTFTGSILEDVKRRDFTINGLVMDKDGAVHDYVNGLPDLKAKIIRAIGDPRERFREDALRTLRAVRFACQLGFTIEPKTLEAIRHFAFRIQIVSAERVRDELSKILTSGRAAYGLRLLHQTGLLFYILPEALKLIDCPHNPLHHPEGDVFTHTIGLLVRLPKDCSLTLALAALLHDIGKPATLAFAEKDGLPTFHGHEDAGAPIAEKIMYRLKYPTDVVEIVVNHVAQHMRFRVAQEMSKSKLYRFLRQPNFQELLALHKLDAMAGTGNMRNAEFVESVLGDVPPERISPPRIITGKDLIELGLKPGPLFKELLEAVETGQLEGQISTHYEAMEFVTNFLAASIQRQIIAQKQQI